MTSSPVRRGRRFVIVWLTLAFLLGLATCSFAAPPSAGPRPDLLVPDGPTPEIVGLFVLTGLAAAVIVITTIADAAVVWRHHRRSQGHRVRMP